MRQCAKCGKPYSELTATLGSKLCPTCEATATAKVDVRCTHCGKKVSPDAKACPNCGQPDPAVARPQCYHCGKELLPDVKACPYCGQSGPATVAQTTVPDYRTWAWLVTLLVCWPLGIPAIVYANKAVKQSTAGNIQDGMQSASRAKRFCWWGMGVALGIIGFFLLAIVWGLVVNS